MISHVEIKIISSHEGFRFYQFPTTRYSRYNAKFYILTYLMVSYINYASFVWG